MDVLIVEDDAALASATARYLTRQGYSVGVVHSGLGALEQVEGRRPRLVLLDLNLPDRDGFWVCEELRPAFCGFILVLTARQAPLDQVRALELGADDYVLKPVEPLVLRARVRAALRRTPPEPAAFGGLVARAGERDLRVDGAPLGLTEVEFSLFTALARAGGGAVDRDALFVEVLGRPWDGLNRSIDVHVCSLRKKLEPWAAIGAVRGVGYRLEDAQA